MRAVVIADDRWSEGGLVLNSEFLRFAAHWRFRPRACRAYRAKTKGKVERPIRYLRQNFFYGRTFLNDDDLNTQGQSWLDGTANVRRHRTIDESPRERFARDECTALTPLALMPYPRLGTPTPRASSTRGPSPVEVQRRSLRVYAEAVR